MFSFKVIALRLAKLDLREAKEWYNDKQPGLGKEFLSDYREVLESLKKHPEAFARRYGNIRVRNFSRFPYAAHYFINLEKHTEHITAILHTSRNPNTGREHYPPGA